MTKWKAPLDGASKMGNALDRAGFLTDYEPITRAKAWHTFQTTAPDKEVLRLAGRLGVYVEKVRS